MIAPASSPAARRGGRTRTRRDASLLDGLGLIGCGSIEPTVVAAIAADLPLLLIGPHGTGKSLLLTRIAEALGLEWRHYNASLLSYDDLVGYPVPDGQGGLTWLRTPATVWDAEAVFLDEINRCRPDLQNKLFPIVHERKVQGMPLERLRHRWAAMNPVAPAGDDDPYVGADTLDAALADRFPFVVTMPDWHGLSATDQERLLLSDLRPVAPSAAVAFRSAVEATRSRYLASLEVPDPSVAIYVRHALRILDEGGVRCSARRGALLVRTILATRATGLLAPHDAALAALLHGLPQRASGGEVKEHVVVAAHRAALHAVTADVGDQVARLLAIPDRLERTIAALEQPDLDIVLRTSVVADGFASLPDGARHAVAIHAFERDHADGLAAAVAAQLAEAYALVLTPQGAVRSIAAGSVTDQAWRAVTTLVASLTPGPEAACTENLLVGLWSAGRIATEHDVRTVHGAWQSARRWLARRPAVGTGATRAGGSAATTAAVAR